MDKGVEWVGGGSVSGDITTKWVGESVPRRGNRRTTHDSPLEERLKNPDAFLNRSDLRELGLPRRAIDAICRVVPVVVFEGYSKPMVRVGDFRSYVEDSTYRRDKVR